MASSWQSEIWLRGNRRAIVVGSLVTVTLGSFGLIGALNLTPWDLSLPLRLAAGILALLAALVGIAMIGQARLPRLAYADQELLVYAGSAKPFRVPMDVVEVFFGGQGATEVQVHGHKIESKNVVVRLAERRKEWHQREIRRSFGRWQDGYIILNGAWCEPITADLVKSLNQRLVETKRAIRNDDKHGARHSDANDVNSADPANKPGGCAVEDTAE